MSFESLHKPRLLRRGRTGTISFLSGLLLAVGILVAGHGTGTLWASGGGASTVTLYVSTDGVEGAAGTKADPFRTVEEARDAIRQLKGVNAQRNFRVWIRGGLYRVTETIVFGPEDSAAPGFTITYAAYSNERPVFSSGVPVTGWTKATQDPAFLASAASGKLWVADFPDGIDRFTTMFDEAGRLPRALGPEVKPELDHLDSRVLDRKTLHFPPGSLRNYQNMADVEIWIVPTFQWSHNLLPLASVHTGDRIARTTVAGTYQLARRANAYDPSRFRVANVPDVLDEPGEWIMNSQSRKIWYWPRDGQKPTGLIIPTLREMFLIAGSAEDEIPVSGLVFDGLTFKHGARDDMKDHDVGLQHDWEFWDKPNALVRFRWTENCVVKNSLFTATGGGAIRFDLYSKNNAIEGCEISYIGGTGIAFIGDKIGADFMNRGNRIHNNHIHHVGLEKHDTPGILIWQSGENTVTHNRVHHTPYNGISVGGVMAAHFSRQWREHGFGARERELARTIDWSRLPFEEMDSMTGTEVTIHDFGPYLYSRDNIFAYNEIYRNVELLGDGNPFYIRMSSTGNVIRRNYFHHTLSAHSAGVVRFDGQQDWTTFEENIVFYNSGSAVTFAKGNDVLNNVFVDTRSSDHVHQGGHPLPHPHLDRVGSMFWLVAGPQRPAIGILDYDQSTIRRNVMVQLQEDYRVFYRDSSHVDPSAPNFTDIKRVDNLDENIFWAPNIPNQSSLSNWLNTNRSHGIDENSVIADPMFVDLANRDFRFLPGSPALQMGIPSLDRREMGLTSTFPGWLAPWVVDDAGQSFDPKGVRADFTVHVPATVVVDSFDRDDYGTESVAIASSGVSGGRGWSAGSTWSGNSNIMFNPNLNLTYSATGYVNKGNEDGGSLSMTAALNVDVNRRYSLEPITGPWVWVSFLVNRVSVNSVQDRSGITLFDSDGAALYIGSQAANFGVGSSVGVLNWGEVTGVFGGNVTHLILARIDLETGKVDAWLNPADVSSESVLGAPTVSSSIPQRNLDGRVFVRFGENGTPRITFDGFRMAWGKHSGSALRAVVHPEQGRYAPFFAVAERIRESQAAYGRDYLRSLRPHLADGADSATLTFEKVSGPGWLTISEDGLLGGTPPQGAEGINYFMVEARNSAGYLHTVELAIFVAAPSTQPPPGPRDIRIGIENNILRLDWDSPEIPDLSHFVVLRSDDLQGFEAVEGPLWEATPYSESVAGKDRAFYIIRVVDTSGNSSQ